MAKDFSMEMSKEQREKMKKNLVYIAIFSIVMIFAGFTSAYIVSMGDTFWVKYPLPKGFWISTLSIILSSLMYQFAVRATKNKDWKKVRVGMTMTLFLGLAFAFFQWKGYGQLVEQGAHFRSSILVVDGRYGDYFEIKYKGEFIDVEGNDYVINGKVLSEEKMNELKQFVKPFENAANTKGYTIHSLPSNFTLYYENEPLSLEGGKLITSSGKILQYTEMRRLQFLAWNIRDNRGDFFHKGELGKDFHVYYKGKELKYKNRDLYFGNKKLSAPLQLKANQSRDTATAYLYIITVLHLLHILGALIYLIKMTVLSFKEKEKYRLSTGMSQEAVEYWEEKRILSLRLGAIFWHFLGILWIYLLIFLLYIH